MAEHRRRRCSWRMAGGFCADGSQRGPARLLPWGGFKEPCSHYRSNGRCTLVSVAETGPVGGLTATPTALQSGGQVEL